VIVAVRAREAIGMKLAQDYTCVTPSYKGAVKKKGDVVREEDVELLEKCGHFVVYVYDEDPGKPGYIHEDEAVDMLASVITGPYLRIEHREEAKAFIYSEERGLVTINTTGLKIINESGVFVVVTRKTGCFLDRNELVGVVELIPMYISQSEFNEIVEKVKPHLPIINLHPARTVRIGVVVTGTEVASGLVRDEASPVVVEKIKRYGGVPGDIVYAVDDEDEIAGRILQLLETHDAVIATGGMSVDPTDYTPHAIRKIADEVVVYGLPIKPTTMTMLAYRSGKPIIGVSAGIIYFREENALDVLLPWIVAGVRIPREYLVSLGEGGLFKSFLDKAGRRTG